MCAFDVAEYLKDKWDTFDAKGKGWATTEKPTVRMISFAAPRVGNATFVRKFHHMEIQALRVENNGDRVPNVPGR